MDGYTVDFQTQRWLELTHESMRGHLTGSRTSELRRVRRELTKADAKKSGQISEVSKQFQLTFQLHYYNLIQKKAIINTSNYLARGHSIYRQSLLYTS
jgi:hypothetical protein